MCHGGAGRDFCRGTGTARRRVARAKCAAGATRGAVPPARSGAVVVPGVRRRVRLFLLGPFPGYLTLVGPRADAVTFFVGSLLFTAGGGGGGGGGRPAPRDAGAGGR